MMGKVVVDISMALDGYVAGPRATLEEPLGENGERLHEWVVELASWRASHGLEGGEENASSKLIAEGIASTGAVVMGRRMFSGGAGSWEDDPKAEGWWGEEPPFRKLVFVVTHHAREPLVLGETTFTFVGGVEPAVEQATAAAGERTCSSRAARASSSKRSPREWSTSSSSTSSRSSSAAARACWTASRPTSSSSPLGSSTHRK
jgi:dihydrofolate reductase